MISPTNDELLSREPENTRQVFKFQVALARSSGADSILVYNKDRSIEGSFHDNKTIHFLREYGPKSFWLTSFKDGIVDLDNGEPVEDPGW